MENLILSDYASIAQIVLTIITLIGILVSIYLSTKALREVQKDRRLRQKPYLQFEPGGIALHIEFLKTGKSILGINPEYAQKALKDMPDDAESIFIRKRKGDNGESSLIHYGHLKNYGSGPALSTRVTWIAKEVWIGSEKFQIDSRKLSEAVYSEGLNTIPSSPSHIMPGGEASFVRLPTFIAKDFEKKITKVEGNFRISCEDVFGGKHSFIQEFYIFTDYRDKEQPNVHVTFSDFIGSE
ncbi:MAG: hypothetical protein ACFFGZ_16875 [Candidatus Thorarchaeota archaeon]